MIHGTFDPKFARVREAFEKTFESPLELGAAIAITIDGKLVVDLWGGHRDGKQKDPWTADTLVNLYSTTKGFTAMCAHRLVDQGVLDLEAPVAKYWPEFAAAGKGDVVVRSLLDHRAGLPAIMATVPNEKFYDWAYMTSALAAQEPVWEPDTAHGYHALTYGWLVGEVIRRASGKTVGTYFREEFTGPLDVDLHIGLAAEHDGRVADIRPGPRPTSGMPTLFDRLRASPQSFAAKAFFNPMTSFLPGQLASRQWRGSEQPAANGHGTARGIAQLYGAIANGSPLLSKDALSRASTERSEGLDLVLGINTRFGLGFMLSQPGAEALGPNPGTFGHPGAGGSLGFADPVAHLGFGYTMNRMGTSILVDPRAASLISALYSCL